jgi:hypothetical protein
MSLPRRKKGIKHPEKIGLAGFNRILFPILLKPHFALPGIR